MNTSNAQNWSKPRIVLTLCIYVPLAILAELGFESLILKCWPVRKKSA